MDNELRKLSCIVEQLKTERQTERDLEGLNLSQGRKEQIMQNRLGEVRRRYGSEMCMDDSVWVRKPNR